MVWQLNNATIYAGHQKCYPFSIICPMVYKFTFHSSIRHCWMNIDIKDIKIQNHDIQMLTLYRHIEYHNHNYSAIVLHLDNNLIHMVVK